MLTIDAHIDTLFVLSGIALQKDPTVTTERMRAGGLDRAIFALYIQDAKLDRMDDKIIGLELLHQLKLFHTHFPEHFIALEGGRCLGEGDPLRFLSDLAMSGIRYLTLCHNTTNNLCGSSMHPLGMEVGLSPLGKAVVRRCEELGVLIDLSHASDKTIEDVLDYGTGTPHIASHSGCRQCLMHARNLKDEHIVQIAIGGGMVCVPFARKFVGTKQGVAHHIDHICHLTGTFRHAGVGSDLDGAALAEGINGVENWWEVVGEQLDKMGYNEDAISAIAGGNLLKLMRERSYVGGRD